MGVTRILLTNRNHSRASNKVRKRTGARTSIHPHDAAHAREQGTLLDDALAVGQTIGPLVVVEAPGKSPGEIGLHWPERRLLIVGDAVIGKPFVHCPVRLGWWSSLDCERSRGAGLLAHA